MIKNWLKKIQHQKICAKTAVLLLFFALSSSCTDQGCIDADDFGEYETQTIEVSANSQQEKCTYDGSLELTDATQGSGLKSCFTAGSTTVYDEAGASQTSTTGCFGFTDATYKNLCVTTCIQNCLSGTGVSGTPEPDWISTDKRSTTANSGVTIRPGSEIIIRAIGTIHLGDSLDYNPIHVQANNPIPHAKKAAWSSGATDVFFDVRNGQTINLKFSGSWSDGSTTVGSGAGAISNATYSGARRIIAYVIPHPEGYNFDTSQSTEQTGTKGTPLLPDALAWTCDYTGSTLTEANCHNKTTNPYSVSAGYTNADNSLAIAVFPLSSDAASDILTSYGGVIRWTGDNLTSFTDDLVFPSTVCTIATGVCTNIDSTPATSGKILGDLSTTSVSILNPTSDTPFRVSFKSLTGDTSCNVTLVVTDSNGVSYSTAVTNSSWSDDKEIPLEIGKTLSVAKLTSSGTCGKGIGVKFNKYHELKMQKSGFVKFTMLNGSGNCTIKARIMNPEGTFASDDIYEYDNFATIPTSSKDPLANLTVPASSSTISWSNLSFVRKGQVIRFSPKSWDGAWTTSAGNRQCGIGMAMMIEPRPALLCRGTASDYVLNTACTQDYNSSGTLIGCKAVASECSDSASTSNYCPLTNCQSTITCPDGVSPLYQKGTCTVTAPTTTACPSESYTTTITSATCTACSNKMKDNASLSGKIALSNMIQCYDLENYTSKVSLIRNGTTGYSDTELADSTITKGLTKISAFNGSYGNLENFVDSGTTDTTGNNKIFQLQQPLTFGTEGRLRFFMLDGSDLNDVSVANNNGAYNAYTNNTVIGSAYSGSNGFKINLSGMLDFSNGQWLQGRLCLEDDSGILCKNSDPIAISDQPQLIEITPPTSTTPAGTPPNISTSYGFDGYGNILRTNNYSLVVNGTTKDCTANDNGVASVAGANFYCHTYQYYSASTLKAKSQDDQDDIESSIQKLRLSFKIMDPEITNCNLSSGADATGSSADGSKLANPIYNTDSCDASDGNRGYYSGSTCDSEGQNCTTICTTNLPNTGKTCTATELATQTCIKQYYCANKYANNSGSYFVNIKVKSEVTGTISSIIGGVIAPVIEVMDGPKTRNCSTTGSIISNDGVRTDNPLYVDTLDDIIDTNTGSTCIDSDGTNCAKQYYCKKANVGQAERVYKLVIADPRFKAIVTMCFVVMFSFYGVGYLMGTSELNHSEIMNRIIKIGIIYLFIGETGWDWFNNLVVRFFKNGTDYLAFMMAASFDDSTNHAVSDAIANSDYYDKSVLFGSVDNVFSMFFSQAVQKKVSALLFASIFGWAYLLIIYQSFMLYVYSVANAVLLYLTAQIFISILFTLGPIFLIFTLFNQTKEMFDNWLKQLIGFSLQQIFLLTTLAFFNMLMYEVIKLSLGYKICWDEVWTINIITRITLLSFWTIASLPPRTNAQSDVGNIGNPEGIPSLFSILFIWVIASLMNKFIGFMTDLAASISGGLSASAMGKGIADAAKEVSAMAKKARQDVWNKTGGQVVQRMDKALFDSGAMADKERNARKANNAKDFSNKSAMSKAGKKAEKDYFNKNEVALSGMKEGERNKILKGVRNAAETKAGKDLGLKDEDIDRLNKDKGFKFEGDTIGGAAASMLKQRFMGAKTLNESLSEKSSDLKLSVAQAGGKGLSTEDAKTLKENIAKGNIDVEKNTAAKLSDVAKTVGGAAGAVGSAMSSAAKAASETSVGKAIGGAASSAASGAASAAMGAATLMSPTEKGDEARAQAGKSISAAGKAISAGAEFALHNPGTTAKAAGSAAIGAGGAAIGAVAGAGGAAVGAVAGAGIAAVGAVAGAGKATGRAIVNTRDSIGNNIDSAAKFTSENKLKTAGLVLASPVLLPAMAVKKTAAAAGKAVSSAANAMSSAADMAERLSDPKGYEATKQLEKETALVRMAPGTNFARPDADKKMIQDRVKQNENEKKSGIKTPDLNTMTGIAKEEAYNKEIAAIPDNARFSEQVGGRISAAAKRYNPIGKQGATIKEDTKKDLLKAAKEQGKEKLTAVKGEKKNLEKGRATAMQDYDTATAAVEEHKNKPESIERAALVTELTEKAKKTHEGFTGTIPRILDSAARKEDKEARKAQSQLRQMGGAEDPKLAELTKKQNLAGAAVRQIDTKLENIKEKLQATEEFDTAATTASEISEEGQQRADLLRDKDEEQSKAAATESEVTNPLVTSTSDGSAAGATAGATSPTGASPTSGSAAKAPVEPRNKNITKLKDKQAGTTQTIAEKKTAAKEKIATAGATKEEAAKERPSLMKRMADKATGKALDPKEEKYQNAVKDEKEGKKEFDDATRLGNAAEKADALSEHARTLMEKEDAARDQDPNNKTPHSGSYERAEELVKKYDSLESPEAAEKFVQEQEDRSKEIAKATKGLDSPEAFKKFTERFDGDKGGDENS
ncbi:MAG: type IV secretion system protein [Pseudomonadota bacterium]